MALILNIDSAVEQASICLSNDLNIVDFAITDQTKNNASFIQPTIKNLIEKNNIKLNDINAIAVNIGPGSYTGLRISLSIAKGLCFALNKPLITINTLHCIANSIIENEILSENTLICPMIDARRMEVFTTLINQKFDEFVPTKAIVLEPNFLEEYQKELIVFCGNGSKKFCELNSNNNFRFSNINYSAINMISLSYAKFISKNFSPIHSLSAFYGKDFYTTLKN